MLAKLQRGVRQVVVPALAAVEAVLSQKPLRLTLCARADGRQLRAGGRLSRQRTADRLAAGAKKEDGPSPMDAMVNTKTETEAAQHAKVASSSGNGAYVVLCSLH